MSTTRLAWLAGVMLAIPAVSLGQHPDPCQPESCGPRTAQFCMPVDGGPKDCCWNRLLKRLCIHDKQYVVVTGAVKSHDCGWNTHGKLCPLGLSCLKCNPKPACAPHPVCAAPAPVCQPAAPACGDPHCAQCKLFPHKSLFSHKPLCQPAAPVCQPAAPVCQPAAPACADPLCGKCKLFAHKPLCKPAAPACGNPACTTCGQGYSSGPVQTPAYPGAFPTPLPDLSAAPRAGGDPTLTHLESLLNAQAADSRAFQQSLEKKLATLAALRAMQDADMQSLTQLENTLRQARLKSAQDREAAPVQALPVRQSSPMQMPPATKIPATESGLSPDQMSQQMDQLNREILELNRIVKQLSNKN